MTPSTSVFFTGMPSSDAENLIGLFHFISQRAANRWSLAHDADNAQIVIADVDTLPGHMAWLRARHRGQIIVALGGSTALPCPEASHRLHRPVTLRSMQQLLQEIGSGQAPENRPTVPNRPPAITPIATAAPAPLPTPVMTGKVTASASASAELNPAATVQDESGAGVHLIDRLLANDFGGGPHVVNLPDLPPLLFDVSQQIFISSSSLKPWLPHTQAALGPAAIIAASASDFIAQRASLGTQPLERLVWLAALGANRGRAPGPSTETQFRLLRWPQIERDFPRHFRIATAMAKRPNTAIEIALQAGTPLHDVHDFIAGYLATHHVLIEGSQGSTQASLLERLRGTR